MEPDCYSRPILLNRTSYMHATVLICWIINCLCIISGFIGNSLVIYAISSTKSLQTNPNVLLLFLAISDWFVNALVEPFFLVLYINVLRPNQECLAMDSRLYVNMSTISAGLSLFTLTLVSLERLFCITQPFQYRFYVTKRALLAVTLISWVVCLATLLAIQYLLTGKDDNIGRGSVEIFCVVVIGACYVKIFESVRRSKKIFALSKDSRVSYCVSQPNPVSVDVRSTERTQPASNNNKLERQTAREREIKLALSLGIIICVLIVCYTPVIVANFSGFFMTREQRLLYGLFLFYPLAETVMFANSAINPILYCLKCRDVRQRIMQILRLV